MIYDVRLTHQADRDIDDICGFIAQHESAERAIKVLQQLLQTIDSLANLPDRGPYPPELVDLGIRDFRQAILPPYRLIYRVQGRTVLVQLIADGRRDMQPLLMRRLLDE